MDNTILRMSLVSEFLSSTMLDNGTFGDDFSQTQSEAATAILNERAAYSVDKRIVAVGGGGNGEIFLYDLFKDAENEWFSLLKRVSASVESFLLAKNPKRILSSVPGTPAGLYSWINNEPAAVPHLTFMNNTFLDAFEQHMYGVHDQYTIDDYDVIDYEDLQNGIEESEKFDMIILMVWDVLGEPDLLKKYVDSLAPGGILHIASTNDSTRIYRNSYHSHPHTELHTVLKTLDGHTFHVSEFYGYTVFIKNAATA